MLSIINFSLILFLIIIAIIFVIISLVLAVKMNRMRQKINQLLEAKAKALEDADRYAELARNPLGPLYTQNTSPLILSFDTNGKIINANERLLQKFGYTRPQLIGKNAIGTILTKPARETDSMIYRLFKNPDLFIDAETEAVTKSGKTFWISWTNKVLYNSKGKPIAADAVGFDITKRKEMEAELQYLSSIDPQTKVMNRHAFLETGATELQRAKRYGRDLSVVVFKFQSEDQDALTDGQLKSVAQMTRQIIRVVDYIGRIGDVEFALILPETAVVAVPFLIRRLQEHLENYNKRMKSTIRLIYSATSFQKKSDTIDGLISRAWHKIDSKKK